MRVMGKPKWTDRKVSKERRSSDAKKSKNDKLIAERFKERTSQGPNGGNQSKELLPLPHYSYMNPLRTAVAASSGVISYDRHSGLAPLLIRSLERVLPSGGSVHRQHPNQNSSSTRSERGRKVDHKTSFQIDSIEFASSS